MTPATDKPLSPWWKPVGIVIVIWGVLLLLAALANGHDAQLEGISTSLERQLRTFFVLLLPTALLSGFLALYFRGLEEHTLGFKHLVWIAFLLFFLYLPLSLLAEIAYLLHRRHHTFPDFSSIITRFSLSSLWLRGMLMLFAFSAHLAYVYWQRNRRQLLAANQARQQLLDLKLVQLQGQLEPYFLLNALEEIECLVVEAEGPLATRALARLSDLLRHVLESTQEVWLKTSDELDFLRDYLSLQNLRFDDRLRVQWEIDEGDWSDYLIPPLLLYPLAEFAIKNMEARLRLKAADMHIHCLVLENHIHVLLHYSGEQDSTIASSLELDNAKQRMFLLYGHTAFIQSVPYPLAVNQAHKRSAARNTNGEPDILLNQCVMLAFPIKLAEDVRAHE